MHPVVDQQRHAGAVQHVDQAPAQGDEIVVGQVMVAQLHERHAGRDGLAHGAHHAVDAAALFGVGDQVDGQVNAATSAGSGLPVELRVGLGIGSGHRTVLAS